MSDEFYSHFLASKAKIKKRIKELEMRWNNDKIRYLIQKKTTV